MELTPLTGGCRRIPVMQIGADVYCASQVIVAELEGRHPEPAAVPVMREQRRAFCSFIEAQLASHGDEPSGSDAHACVNPWFVSKFVPGVAAPLLEEFPRLRAWMARIEAIGYGNRVFRTARSTMP